MGLSRNSQQLLSGGLSADVGGARDDVLLSLLHSYQDVVSACASVSSAVYCMK